MNTLKIFRNLFLAGFIGLIAVSCFYDNEEELYPATNTTPQPCDTTDLTYDGKIANIINTNCASRSCHDGSRSPNLTDYNRVSGRVDRIQSRAIERGDMPPSGRTPLTDCEKQQLQDWINNGAPEN